jgi:hypothetical protein
MYKFKVMTLRILDCLDWDEYMALTAAKKNALLLFVSAYYISFEEGSIARTKLWEMFPEGTTTGDNFRDVANGLIRPPDAPEEE